MLFAHAYFEAGLAVLVLVCGPVLAVIFLIWEIFRRRKYMSEESPQARRIGMPFIGGLVGLWGGCGLGCAAAMLSYMLLDHLIQDELQLAYACGALFAMFFVVGMTVKLVNRGKRSVLTNIGRGISLGSLISIAITKVQYSWEVDHSDESLLLGVVIVVLVGIALVNCIFEVFAATDGI